jgi:hypothetical protein
MGSGSTRKMPLCSPQSCKWMRMDNLLSRARPFGKHADPARIGQFADRRRQVDQTAIATYTAAALDRIAIRKTGNGIHQAPDVAVFRDSGQNRKSRANQSSSSLTAGEPVTFEVTVQTSRLCGNSPASSTRC